MTPVTPVTPAAPEPEGRVADSELVERELTDDELDVDPVFAPWDGRRVPVTLLGGYLGAGKTTLINELLARADQPIAVLVNDVGAVNIDARLIARHHGDTIELTDGCVCCSLAGGLVDAFEQLRARPTPPDLVLMELSGVAIPGRVAPWANTPGFRLDGVVILVDADQFADRYRDPALGAVVAAQVAAADVLVLTKLDLAEPTVADDVRALLNELAPGVPVLDVGHAMHAAALIGLGARRSDGVADLPQAGLFDPHRTDLIPLPLPVGRSELDELLDQLPGDVLRAKGIAEHDDGSRSVIQIVGRRRSVGPLPQAEDQPPTDLVVIRPV